MDERRGLSSRVVLTGLSVSLVLALGVAFYIYVRYVRYEAVAARHLPAALDVAVHVNVQQAVVYEPFRKHLLHLFEAGRTGPEPRVKHLERKTTLELGVDMREVVFAFGREGAFGVSAGGLFRRKAVVEGAGRMLEDEGIRSEVRKDPTRLVLDNGASFAVADDGSLLVTSSESLLTQAFEPSAARPGLGGAGVLASLVARRPGGYVLAQGQRVESVVATVRAGDGFPYEVSLEVSGAGWELPLDVLGAQSSGPWSVWAGLPEPQIDRPAADRVRLRGTLTRPEFEQLLARLAGFVRSALRLPI